MISSLLEGEEDTTPAMPTLTEETTPVATMCDEGTTSPTTFSATMHG